MGQPKKQSSMRKTGTRRSHLLLKLARRVNGKSPVKAITTKHETGKKLVRVSAVKLEQSVKPVKKVAKKVVAKK